MDDDDKFLLRDRRSVKELFRLESDGLGGDGS